MNDSENSTSKYSICPKFTTSSNLRAQGTFWIRSRFFISFQNSNFSWFLPFSTSNFFRFCLNPSNPALRTYNLLWSNNLGAFFTSSNEYPASTFKIVGFLEFPNLSIYLSHFFFSATLAAAADEQWRSWRGGQRWEKKGGGTPCCEQAQEAISQEGTGNAEVPTQG